jgi:hypothetical protein
VILALPALAGAAVLAGTSARRALPRAEETG